MSHNFFVSFLAFALSLSAFGSEIAPNFIKSGDISLKKKVAGTNFEITTVQKVQSISKSFSFNGGTQAPVAAKNPESLVLGYPLDQLNKESVFGGVITKVSNKTDTNLGGLKLANLTTLHVKANLIKDPSGALFFALMGCPVNCTQSSQDEMLIAFPVIGVNDTKKLVYIDLAQVGKEMDIIGFLGAAEFFKLEHVHSNTTGFDFSDGNLVFDVESLYRITGQMEEDPSIPKDVAKPQDTQSLMTTRYYIKLNPKVNPDFVPRSQRDEVGFFTTERAEQTKITRFDVRAGKTVKYYIKYVPLEYQSSFKKAFDAWNKTFQGKFGYPIFTYQFVNKGDPLGEELVTGDIRYNVLEWDLNNLAGYGGLGPSIANQYTGENINANVLIQGPHVVELYKEWFGVSKDIQLLTDAGDINSANQLKFNLQQKFDDSLKESIIKHKITLGNKLSFQIPAEDPSYQDSVAKLEFEQVPAGYTYERYMDGYFLDMVAHELGHNIGLRHNFVGNLGSTDQMTVGSVSRSIMEYLGRGYRYLDQIGPYDFMAINYGYNGVTPTEKTWFCTDENVPSDQNPMGSAECSRDDATSDPFSFFESRLARAINLVVNRGSPSAPIWTQDDISKAFNEAVNGLGLYAATAPFSAKQWTNFFGKLDRPEKPEIVPAYAAKKLDALLCDPTLKNAVLEKTTEAAKQKTTENIQRFQTEASKKLLKFNGVWEVFNKDNIRCLVQTD